jgi:hypothetical protein
MNLDVDVALASKLALIYFFAITIQLCIHPWCDVLPNRSGSV